MEQPHISLKRRNLMLGAAATSFFAAAQVAPPSGATKRPSAAPISSQEARISSSVTVSAEPPEARTYARIR